MIDMLFINVFATCLSLLNVQYFYPYAQST